MLYYLHMLSEYFGGLNLFKYITMRATGAALTAFFITTLLGPAFIRSLKKHRIGEKTKKGDSTNLDRLHASKKDTPTMGGLVVVFALMMSTLLWARISFAYIGIVLAVVAALATIGFIDDYLKLVGGKGMKSRMKMLLLVLVAISAGGLYYGHVSALTNIGVPDIRKVREKERIRRLEGREYEEGGALAIVWSVFGALDAPEGYDPESAADSAGTGGEPESVLIDPGLEPGREALTLHLPFFKDTSIYLGFFFVLFAALVLCASSNAVNLTDGLDGLAAGNMVMVSLAFVVIAYLIGREDFSAYLSVVHVPGAGEISIFCAALFGACLGFLWFNCHPAQVFLGDTGALALGGSVGMVSVIIKQELLLLIVGGIFVAEAASVILQVASFRLFGKRIFRIAPLHHHFEFKNWHENKITIRFWIVGAMLAMFAIASLKIR